MKLGTNTISTVKLGTNQVQKVYLGTNEVWSSFDADAQAFFDRVTTAGGSLSTTEKTAVNTLVIQMKTDGIWTKMKAIYPMVGASAAACAQNLKSSSFTGTFISGGTYASTGYTTNALGYMETNIYPSTHLSQNSTHLSYYSRVNNSGPFVDMGIGSSPQLFLLYNYSGTAFKAINRAESVSGTSFSPTTSLLIANRPNSTTEKHYRAGSLVDTLSISSTGINTNMIYLGAYNRTGAEWKTARECAFASIGDGLTDTEASNLYTAVQAFQTTLSRQV
jgi:hypothetical protein